MLHHQNFSSLYRTLLLYKNSQMLINSSCGAFKRVVRSWNLGQRNFDGIGCSFHGIYTDFLWIQLIYLSSTFPPNSAFTVLYINVQNLAKKQAEVENNVNRGTTCVMSVIRAISF